MNARRQPDRLRPDLQILRTGPDAFRLVDPVSGAHFELHGKERYLLSLIDRCDDIQEISAEYGRKFGQPLADREVREFLEQLRRECLLVGSRGTPPAATDEIPHRSALPIRLRGNSANVFFDVLTLLFGWVVHPLWLLVIVPACVFEVALLVAQWDLVFLDLQRTLYEVPLLPLFLASYVQTILLLNLPLALVIGISCRKFKGRVRSFGMTSGNWLLPTISFFTDTGDSIVGMSTRGRRTLIAVGILVPVALGAFYAFCWGASSRAHEGHKFWALMIVPAAIVALYQCNPFSIFSSGHWALAAAVNDWKLHVRALEETKAWFWARTSPEPLSPRERRWLRAYGVSHYLLRFGADLGLLAGGGYFLISTWGSVGAAVMLFLVVWWNRAYLEPLWHPSKMTFARI